MKIYGWYANIVEIANTGILGKLQEVEKSNMWDFLNVLTILRAENEYQNQ